MPAPLPPSNRSTGSGAPAADIDLLVVAVAELQAGLGTSYVTLDTDQTITGQKTFTDYINVNDGGGVNVYDDAGTDVGSGSANLWPGAMRLTAANATSGAEHVIILLASKYWNGSASTTAQGSITMQPNDGEPYFEFDQPVQAPNLLTTELYDNGIEFTSGAGISMDDGYIDIFSGDGSDVYIDPFRIKIQAADATAETEQFAVFQMYTSYWNGSSSTNLFGELDFQPNGGFPYFEFNKPVQATVFRAFSTTGTDALTVSLASMADAGTPIKDSPVLSISSSYYAGGSSFDEAIEIQALRNSATTQDHYLQISSPVQAPYLTVIQGGWIGDINDPAAGYIDLTTGNLGIAPDAATAETGAQQSTLSMYGFWWNGSSSAQVAGQFTFKPSGGDPYFEFDKPLYASSYVYANPTGGGSGYGGIYVGGLDLRAADRTGPGQTICSAQMISTWWNGSASEAVAGTINVIANLGDPYFEFNVPLSASGPIGSGAGPARLAGGTASGAPVSGTFAARDFVVTTDGHIWVCTAGGTPGTWRDLG